MPYFNCLSGFGAEVTTSAKIEQWMMVAGKRIAALASHSHGENPSITWHEAAIIISKHMPAIVLKKHQKLPTTKTHMYIGDYIAATEPSVPVGRLKLAIVTSTDLANDILYLIHAAEAQQKEEK